MRRLLRKPDIGMLTAFLMREETANTFLLGNLLCYGIEDDPRVLRCGDYWGFFSGSTLTGVAAFFNNSQCMVYYTDESQIRAICEEISGNPVRLVLGSDRCVRPMTPLLRGIPGRMVVHRQLFMEHSGRAPAGPAPVLAYEDARRKGNNRAVQDFIMRCMKEGFGYNISRGTVKRLLKEKTEFEPYLLAAVSGKYVAQAHIQTRTPGYCQIGGVCTLPEERHRGYARAVVGEMMSHIATDGGRRACLVVNEDNTSARRLYDSMGFVEAGQLMLVDYL